MPFLLAKVIGSGVEGDAFRVKLPTYRLRYIDYASRHAIIEIDQEDCPEGCPEVDFTAPWMADARLEDFPPEERTNPEVLERVKPKTLKIIRLGPEHRAAMRDLIRRRYQEGFSNWEPENALES